MPKHVNLIPSWILISHTCFLGISFFSFFILGYWHLSNFQQNIVGKHEAVLYVVMVMVFSNGWRRNMLLFGILVKCILTKCTTIKWESTRECRISFCILFRKTHWDAWKLCTSGQGPNDLHSWIQRKNYSESMLTVSPKWGTFLHTTCMMVWHSDASMYGQISGQCLWGKSQCKSRLLWQWSAHCIPNFWHFERHVHGHTWWQIWLRVIEICRLWAGHGSDCGCVCLG